MMGNALTDALHAVSQGLMYPVIALLLIMVAFVIVVIGSLVAEIISEHRHFKVYMPDFLQEIEASPLEQAGAVIQASTLLKRQKNTLITLFNNRNLHEEARFALAKRLITDEASHYNGIVARTNLVSKIAPMLGLMGTLIPLGPGIVALGIGDTELLSQSLLIAFDTTVAGLIVAVVCLAISFVRKRWYADYATALEVAMTALLEQMDLADSGDVEARPKPLPLVTAGATAAVRAAKETGRKRKNVRAVSQVDAVKGASAAEGIQ